MRDVVTAILGGGQGQRLWPLTRERAKPAVPFGGKFRLIDIPISNSLHAGCDRIYVLTQFNSASLHHHIAQAYRFDVFRGGFVHILAAEQGTGRRDWYEGTADAIRQNLPRLVEGRTRDVLILSGDQLYLMRLDRFIDLHRRTDAEISVAVKPVSKEEATGLGCLRVDAEGRIVEFVEKPKDPAVLDRLALDEATLRRFGADVAPGRVLASLGIYLFRSDILRRVLEGTTEPDFGRDVLPKAIHVHRVQSFFHTGYWRDIGTIAAFHEASLDLTRPLPPLNLYDPDRPIYTHARFLPGTKINRCQVEQSILCEGSIITEATVSNSIVGIRAVVRQGTTIEDGVVFGARSFEPDGPAEPVPLGIGRDVRIRRAIVDFDTRIGDGARILNERGVSEADGPNYFIRGGIVVIPRGAAIAPGTVI